MSISTYEASNPHFIRILNNLSLIIDKTKTYTETKKIEETVLINAGLAPDMYSLSQQIRIAADLWNLADFLINNTNLGLLSNIPMNE